MKFSFARGVAALFVAMPFAASAQEASADPDLLEEIIVTAQKRATSLQDVPFSIAAMTAEDLEQAGATNIVEVARNVPGLYIADLGPGQSQVAIRGISAGQVVRDQPGVKESVGIYLDESPISTCTTSTASKCCAARRARCSAPAPPRVLCATSPRNRTSASSAVRST